MKDHKTTDDKFPSYGTTNYRETDDECPSCGATASERKENNPDAPQGLSECPFCHTEKCCLCDAGDDVGCPSCGCEPG